MPKNKGKFLHILNFKNKKTFIVIAILLVFVISGFNAFIFNKIKTNPQEAKANSLAIPSIYQVNLNPSNLNVGQVYDLNSSNIKFKSTNPYYSINVDYTFSSPGARRVYAKLKGLGSSSFYPVSSLCINDEFYREKTSGSGSFSGSGIFSGSGLFRPNNALNTDKIALTIPYFWNNNPQTFGQCKTANTNFTASEYQFTNYNYKAFDLPDNYSAVVSITELPSDQIDSSEIMYFITSLPQKSTIYLSGKAESDYLNSSYNFRFSNPSEAGKPNTPTPCQRSTYYYLNVDAIDCFTQKDLETGKVKIKVLDNATIGTDQIKLVAFDKFHTKAFDYNFNIVKPNTNSGSTTISFNNNQNSNSSNNNSNSSSNNNDQTSNQNSSQQNPSSTDTSNSAQTQPKTEEIKINPENLPYAFKSKSQNPNGELELDAVFGLKKKLVKGVTNFNFTVSKISQVDPKRSQSEFTCKLFADNIFKGDKNKISELISNTVDKNSCAITFTKDKTKKYNKSAKFYIKIIDPKSGHIYSTNKLSVAI